MLLNIKNTHFIEFQRLSNLPLYKIQKEWQGQSTKQWARSFLTEYHMLPNFAMNRHDLKDYFSNHKNSHDECFLACMAWGGMNRRHGAMAWQERERFLPIIGCMRRGELSRHSAYNEFHSLGKIPGLGPAYYTKLIYFSLPQHDGYIMDQWTGKSVHLITDRCYPKVTQQGWIDRNNDSNHYETFCSIIDEIATYLNIENEEVEERMFSSGGRNKGMWRSYVVQQW